MELNRYLNRWKGQTVCVAFSGGVDSAYLVKACIDCGLHVEAVTFETFLHPHGDLERAKDLAERLGAAHTRIAVDELSDPRILQNPPERCYYCKHLLFTTLRAWAAERGIETVLDGTNADDLHEYRPGLRALQELGIASPLAECGLSKAEIRAASGVLGLETADKPSAPCLATRLPYGTTITPELLSRIDAGEALLRDFGFYNLRLRCHGEVARIEVDLSYLEAVLAHREQIVTGLQALGFRFVTLDLAGFQSGSYDRHPSA